MTTADDIQIATVRRGNMDRKLSAYFEGFSASTSDADARALASERLHVTEDRITLERSGGGVLAQVDDDPAEDGEIGIDGHGYEWMRLRVGRRVALIPQEQKLLASGLVFLGPGFEKTHHATLPADPFQGRPADQVMRGFTVDERTVRIVREWLQFEPVAVQKALL
jgi:hypothetical protein